jgi:hypothetical protein
MRIGTVRHERRDGRTRVSARVVWEDTTRDQFDLYFETDDQFASGLTSRADAFLIAAVLPAFKHGERRIAVDGQVSPELIQGLTTVMAWLREWSDYQRDLTLLDVVPAAKIESLAPRNAGFFLSGGVDSLATLRLNREHYPETHPGSIRDGILVYGLEVEQPDMFALAVAAAQAVAAESDITLQPLYTNIRHLDEDWVFYRDQWQGAILAAVGHALANRLSVISIAATYDIPNLAPWGSHPLLDPNFSTCYLRVVHDAVVMSRLEKVKLLLEWPTALKRMRVCNRTELYKPGTLNCGQCEKCVRTMLELLALQALERAEAFAQDDVAEDLVSRVHIHDDYVASCYRDLLEPLKQHGRRDLVRGIEHALTRYRGKIGYKEKLRRFDRRYLNGSVAALKRTLVGASSLLPSR